MTGGSSSLTRKQQRSLRYLPVEITQINEQVPSTFSALYLIKQSFL